VTIEFVIGLLITVAGFGISLGVFKKTVMSLESKVEVLKKEFEVGLHITHTKIDALDTKLDAHAVELENHAVRVENLESRPPKSPSARRR